MYWLVNVLAIGFKPCYQKIRLWRFSAHTFSLQFSSGHIRESTRLYYKWCTVVYSRLGLLALYFLRLLYITLWVDCFLLHWVKFLYIISFCTIFSFNLLKVVQKLLHPIHKSWPICVKSTPHMWRVVNEMVTWRTTLQPIFNTSWHVETTWELSTH